MDGASCGFNYKLISEKFERKGWKTIYWVLATGRWADGCMECIIRHPERSRRRRSKKKENNRGVYYSLSDLSDLPSNSKKGKRGKPVKNSKKKQEMGWCEIGSKRARLSRGVKEAAWIGDHLARELRRKIYSFQGGGLEDTGPLLLPHSCNQLETKHFDSRTHDSDVLMDTCQNETKKEVFKGFVVKQKQSYGKGRCDWREHSFAFYRNN